MNWHFTDFFYIFYDLGFKAHKTVETCLVGHGIHNAIFYAGDDFYYDENGAKGSNLTEIGCPTLTQELDNVCYNHSPTLEAWIEVGSKVINLAFFPCPTALLKALR